MTPGFTYIYTYYVPDTGVRLNGIVEGLNHIDALRNIQLPKDGKLYSIRRACHPFKEVTWEE